MAEAENKAGFVVNAIPEIPTQSVSVGRDGKGEVFQPQEVFKHTAGLTDEERKELEEDLEDGDKLPDPETPAAEEVPKPEGEEEEVPEAGDLPEYKKDDPEAIAAYDAKYLTVEGEATKLNLNAFNAELEANVKAGKLDINPGSREWVKDTFGVDDQAINMYLKGLQTEADAKDQAIYSLAGGEEQYNSMVEWATAENGYTEAQKVKFREAVAKGGEEAEAQIALLKSRFEKAGGKAPAAKPSVPQVGLRNRRPSSPAKTVNGSPAPAKKVEGFKDPEEHRVAMIEAGEDPVKLAALRERTKASSWFGK